MRRHLRLLPLLLGLLALTGLTQACGEFSAAVSKPRVFAFDFSSLSAAVLQPATDKLDANCMTKSDYDACVFAKNPVAQTKAALTGPVVSNNYDTTQIYGVKLTGLAPSGRLESDTFAVTSLNGSPVSAQDATALKTKAQNDATTRFSQVMIYYWLNRATEYLSAHTGYFPASGKKIRVVVDDLFNGWSSAGNSIHLKAGDNPAAWSPELAIHFLGLANLHYATQGRTDLPSDSTHKDCGVSLNGCCRSQLGCSRAIASGVGDYFAAMMFPDQPVIGETWANQADGISTCGLSRNLAAAASRTAKAAFDACSARPGDVTALGHIYASIWWEVRKAAAQQSPQGLVEIDALFMNHLTDLDGGDDFRSALAKIRSLDTGTFGGRHIPLFEAQYAARGL